MCLDPSAAESVGGESVSIDTNSEMNVGHRRKGKNKVDSARPGDRKCVICRIPTSCREHSREKVPRTVNSATDEGSMPSTR